MLLEPNPKLEEQVVELLARRPAVSAAWLHQELQVRGRQYTIQAIYQELRKLQRSGIVLKTGELYSLRLGWMIELMDLTQSMYENYLRQASSYELLPSAGERRSWTFYNLHSLVTFTTQLGLVLFKESSERVLYEYGPHIWYHLAHHQNEEQFMNAVRLQNFTYYAVIGADTHLDRSYQRFFENIDGEIIFGRCPLSKSQADSYVYVTGDFVSLVKLSKTFNRAIEELFASVKSARDVSVGKITDVFHKRGRVTLRVSNDPAQARRLKRKFRIFLGV